MADAWLIDVSRWQGWIDWFAVRDAGVQGAWAKCGGADGGLYPDSQWSTNRANAAAAGMPFGSYFFASPAVGDGGNQARYAVGLGFGAGDQQLVPVLDIEHNPHGLSPGQLDDFAENFCAETEALLGRRPCAVYSGAYFGVGTNPGHPIGHRPFWVANYGSNTPSTSPPNFEPPVPAAWADTGWSAWQFNSVTMIPGIVGNTVDQNTVTAAAWDAMQNGSGNQEDDMPALASIVRTQIGSAWALQHVGRNDISCYLLLVEGSRNVRPLGPDALSQECFWLSMDINAIWEVDDAFLWQRYYYQGSEQAAAASTATATSTPAMIGVGVFALILVALLWFGIFLGDRAGWYDIDRAQAAALVGLVVLAAALVAAFVRAKLPALTSSDGPERPLEGPESASGRRTGVTGLLP